MSTQVNTLFEKIWNNYLDVTPSAKKIHHLLGSGSDVINDHVAYRTFNIGKVSIDKLAQHLIALGYTECDEYHFEAKKLYAKHFEHTDSKLPKVFISELLVEEFSPQAQEIIHELVDSIDESLINKPEFLYSGKQWQISYQDYQTLLAESEYAAWLSAWGYRANHFTVSINHLANFENILDVNQTLKTAGFTLNTAGGEVKGDSEVKLDSNNFNVLHAGTLLGPRNVKYRRFHYS